MVKSPPGYQPCSLKTNLQVNEGEIPLRDLCFNSLGTTLVNRYDLNIFLGQCHIPGKVYRQAQ